MLHRRYFSLWDISKPHIEAFNEQTNLHHPIIKFKGETSDTETVFRHDTKAQDSRKKYILDVKTHFKQTKTFLYTKNGFVRGEALRTLRKTPQKQPLTKIIQISKKRLMDRATHKIR